MVLKNRKSLKLVVCVSLIVALAISALGISVWATFENTHYNSGEQASDIVGIAQTQVGYGEGYDGYTKYGDWYGLPYSDWCAMFVSWCANQAGVDTSQFPSFALCSAGCDWFISQGRFHYSGEYVPQAGDLIFYSSYGDIYHVGLVTGSDGYNVYSIEGNYNEMVCNVSYSLSYGDILGYATPAYKTAGASAPVVEQQKEEEEEEDSEEIPEVIETVETETETDSVVEDSDVSEEVVTTDTEDETDVVDSEADTEADVETDSSVEEVTTVTDSSEDKEEEDTSVEPKTEEIKVPNGDVNSDEATDSYDSLLIQRYLVWGENIDDIDLTNADVNASGMVDIGDALTILKMAIGLV